MEKEFQLDKVLCFGVLCHLMLIFANKIDTVYISQEKLVSRFVSYVDKNNKLLLSDKDKINADPEVEEVSPGLGPKGKLKGHNASEISRIMRGNSFLTLNTNLGKISINDSTDLFKNRMASYFLEGDKPLLMLSLLDIIKNDTNISDYIRTSFVTSIDDKGVNYSFSEFMIKILLYTAHNGASKAMQKNCLVNIYKYMDTNIRGKAKFSMDNEIVLANHIKEVSNYYPVSTYEWNLENQTLTIFDKSILQGVSPETVNADYNETMKLQNANPSEDNCNENSIAPEETLASKVDEFTEGNLISEEMMEQITKELFGDTEKKSNSKPQKKSKKNANVPDIYKICRFCKKFNPDTNNDSKEGDCSAFDEKVRMDQIACEKYKHNMNAIIDYEIHLPPGEGHM